MAGRRKRTSGWWRGLQRLVLRLLLISVLLSVGLVASFRWIDPPVSAVMLKRLVDEFEVTHEEAAHAVGRSRAAVSNLLRLLDLPLAVRELLAARKLEMGHARALLSLVRRSLSAALAIGSVGSISSKRI